MREHAPRSLPSDVVDKRSVADSELCRQTKSSRSSAIQLMGSGAKSVPLPKLPDGIRQIFEAVIPAKLQLRRVPCLCPKSRRLGAHPGDHASSSPFLRACVHNPIPFDEFFNNQGQGHLFAWWAEDEHSVATA